VDEFEERLRAQLESKSERGGSDFEARQAGGGSSRSFRRDNAKETARPALEGSVSLAINSYLNVTGGVSIALLFPAVSRIARSY
jgi:hypothetical protein